MDQLRIYTLVNKETAEHYFTVHWAQHRLNLPKFGFEVKGVWIGNALAITNQVIAIVSFPDNENVEEMTERYFKSIEYTKLMEGFDRSNFTNVETIIMKPAD